MKTIIIARTLKLHLKHCLIDSIQQLHHTLATLLEITLRRLKNDRLYDQRNLHSVRSILGPNKRQRMALVLGSRDNYVLGCGWGRNERKRNERKRMIC